MKINRIRPYLAHLSRMEVAVSHGILRFVLKNDAQSPSWLRIQPKYNRAKMTCGFLSFFAALGFFWRGLDDKTDPYRFFHGCWHMSVGLSGACAVPAFPFFAKNEITDLIC